MVKKRDPAERVSLWHGTISYPIFCPQSGQNFAPSDFAPHPGQNFGPVFTAVPQSGQNFAVPTDTPQLPHRAAGDATPGA